MVSFTIFKIVLIATVAIGMAGGLIAWRERPTPGSIPLAAMLAGQCWWSVTLLFRIDATGIAAKAFWVDVSWIGIGVIPVAWLFFSLEYAGHHEYVKRRYIAYASVIPAITAVLGVTSPFHDLLYVYSTLVEVNGTMVLDRTPGPWFWVIAGYTYLLGLLGAIPLLDLITSDVFAFRGQSVAVIVGLVVPWATNVFFLLGVLPTAGIDPTPIGFAVSGVAYLGALTRFRLLGTNPAPIRYARRFAFDRMENGTVVLDANDNLVEMNEQAIAALEADPSDVLGRPIDAALPRLAERITTQQTGSMVFHSDDGTRSYDIAVREITDHAGRTIGRSITLHDISDHIRQQHRLAVLNRVFRHNVRSTTQLILGRIEDLADPDDSEPVERLRRHALEIEALSEKVRHAIEMFDRSRKPTRSFSLDSILKDSLASMQAEYPNASIEYDPASENVYVDDLLATVFDNLIENTVEHNPHPHPRVSIAVETDGESACVTVTDNGPGITDQELAVLERDIETPLKHGSGLGLSLVKWGVDIAGGEIEFARNDPTGTVVTVRVPVRPRTADASSETQVSEVSPSSAIDPW